MSDAKKSDAWESAQNHNELRVFMSWISVILTALMAVAFFGVILYRGVKEGFWKEVTSEHFAAIVGLPAAAVASLFAVLVLRMAAGPIEVSLGNLKFRGAAAPIVFWLIGFLAIAASIKMLW